MSGSEWCETKPRTGPQGIAKGRVAEMFELAVVLTNRPDASHARAALAHLAEELLKEGADPAIDQAIQAAPSREIARTLQHVVEAASERVVVYHNGVRAERLLFAVPVIATFGQNVPESQFESALSGLTGLNGLARTKQGELEFAQVILLPKLFRLNDLIAMPLSIVREHGIHLAMAALSRHREWLPPITQDGGFKRSTAFLRFLVGQRPLLEHEDRAGEDGLCERLEGLTNQAISRCLGLPCRVQAVYVGSFHEGLYSGMWLYQERRLDQLARASWAMTRRKQSLEARLMTYGCGHRFEMWVGFFAGNEAIGGHAYRLRLRPSEDPSRCMSRITSRLEVAGIKASALTQVDVPEERAFGRRMGGKVGSSVITIPI